ncbi:MAG: GNAT family N-acetyltransferase [Clostridia bacterium]|nr:GNAT family N-acetyltransferase [Clostridia bacterium]
MNNFNIRRYEEKDCVPISNLFYETVHSVNAKDYTQAQLFAWAKNKSQLLSKNVAFLNQFTLVAEIGEDIIGFGSIDESNCLEMLYVGKDFLRQGVATALCNQLEKGRRVVKTYASITAKPFFEKRGYTVVRENQVERLGLILTNYEMQKSIL